MSDVANFLHSQLVANARYRGKRIPRASYELILVKNLGTLNLKRQGDQLPDLIIVATDANCKGLNERTKEFLDRGAPVPVILAIPDPHVERWLLLDGAAFRAVFGKGCDAPDRKCSRDRYKQQLVNEIRNAGAIPALGGIEFAEDIVNEMDIDRAARADNSFSRFIEAVTRTFRTWKE